MKNKFEGNNFIDCTLNGREMNDGDQPINMGNGNVAFPDGWTNEQITAWRKKNNVPGRGWQPLN